MHSRAMVFSAEALRAIELRADDVAMLQRFYEANPEYHLMVCGQPPRADEARQSFEKLPPAGWPFERKWLLGFIDGDGSMIGMADVISNLFAEGIWHIGLFIVATSLHGTGSARRLHDSLESWMRSQGAHWSRLGVVEGHARAERFWEALGYREVRKRHGVEMGKRVNTLRVMVKPLANGPLSEYLAMVERDRPESP